MRDATVHKTIVTWLHDLSYDLAALLGFEVTETKEDNEGQWYFYLFKGKHKYEIVVKELD